MIKCDVVLLVFVEDGADDADNRCRHERRSNTGWSSLLPESLSKLYVEDSTDGHAAANSENNPAHVCEDQRQ